MVKRFYAKGMKLTLGYVHPDTQLVLASEYDTLARSLRESWASEKRLAAHIAELKAALKDISDHGYGYGGHVYVEIARSALKIKGDE